MFEEYEMHVGFISGNRCNLLREMVESNREEHPAGALNISSMFAPTPLLATTRCAPFRLSSSRYDSDGFLVLQVDRGVSRICQNKFHPIASILPGFPEVVVSFACNQVT